jgi:hypothetical protein
MRTAAWMLATVASVALLAGCRNTTCQDLAEVYADVDKKSRPCMEGAPLAAFDASHCEQNLPRCEEDDLEQLDYQVHCYQQLDACQPEQKASFLGPSPTATTTSSAIPARRPSSRPARCFTPGGFPSHRGEG